MASTFRGATWPSLGSAVRKVGTSALRPSVRQLPCPTACPRIDSMARRPRGCRALSRRPHQPLHLLAQKIQRRRMAKPPTVLTLREAKRSRMHATISRIHIISRTISSSWLLVALMLLPAVVALPLLPHVLRHQDLPGPFSGMGTILNLCGHSASKFAQEVHASLHTCERRDSMHGRWIIKVAGSCRRLRRYSFWT